jgi:hypothetical protein
LHPIVRFAQIGQSRNFRPIIGIVVRMTVTTAAETGGKSFLIEDITTGANATGFGRLGDGRSFVFGVQRPNLVVALYRAGHTDPVPLTEDLVAVAKRPLRGIDLADERSVAAAVRDVVRSAR